MIIYRKLICDSCTKAMMLYCLSSSIAVALKCLLFSVDNFSLFSGGWTRSLSFFLHSFIWTLLRTNWKYNHIYFKCTYKLSRYSSPTHYSEQVEWVCQRNSKLLTLSFMACKILFPFSWWLDESLWPEPTLVLLQIRTFIPRPGKKTHFLLSNCVLGLGVRKRDCWSRGTPWAPPNSWLCDSPCSHPVLFLLWIHWVTKPALWWACGVCTPLAKKMSSHQKILTCILVKVILQKFQKPLLEYLGDTEYTER